MTFLFHWVIYQIEDNWTLGSNRWNYLQIQNPFLGYFAKTHKVQHLC